VSSEGGSFSYASYHVGSDWVVRCSTYDDTTPILSLDAGPSVVTITAKGKTATVTALEFARALAREARKFAEEMERMYAAQLTSDNEGSTDTAAGCDAA
jgi:hypothetical protein